MSEGHGSLFPLKIIKDYPYKPSSVVLKRQIQAEDGLTYAVKGKVDDNDFTPVNEWICASIGGVLGIPMPPFALIEDKNGDKFFGSRWAAGLKPHPLYYMTVEDPTLYSAIMAFDLLMLNRDRHMGNYLITDTAGQNKLLAFDHSHALLHNNPLPGPDKIIELNPAFSIVLNAYGMKPNKGKAQVVLEKFSDLPPDFFDKIVYECRHWLSADEAKKLCKWLKERSSCLPEIEKRIGGLS